MAVVNTNISASLAQASLARNERALSKAMEQLSTGRKINTAADDAAGEAGGARADAPPCSRRRDMSCSRVRLSSSSSVTLRVQAAGVAVSGR